MTNNQVLEIINLCQANALTPKGKLGKELLPDVREMLSAPAQRVDEAQLRQLFKNNSNCYADTWSQDGLGAPMVEGDVIQAMTEERFIEVVAPIAGSRWQQGQQGNVNPGFDIWTKEALNLLHWSSLGADVLSTMCKKVNLTAGAEKAKELSENIKSFLANPSKSPRVPAATEPTPPQQPAPTIGARWVPGPPKLDDKIDSERVYVCKTGRDYSVWVVAHVQLGFYTYPALCDGKKVVDIENFYCDYHYMLSPATFPTREQADEWALETFIPNTGRRTAALAMYDWIVQQIKQK